MTVFITAVTVMSFAVVFILWMTGTFREHRILCKGQSAEVVVVKIVYTKKPEYVVTLKDTETGQFYTEHVPIPVDADAKNQVKDRDFPKNSRWSVKVLGNEAVRVKRLDVL